MGETDTATSRVLGEPLRRAAFVRVAGRLRAAGLDPAGLAAPLPARERRAA